MIPADGPYKVCADFILHDRIAKALVNQAEALAPR
jgi:hypothetical protein